MAARMQIQRATTVSLYGPFTVGDLRAALEGLPAEGGVRITSSSDQRDGTTTTITVHGVGA